MARETTITCTMTPAGAFAETTPRVTAETFSSDRWTGSGVRSIRVIDCLASAWHGALGAAVATWNARFPWAQMWVDGGASCPHAMEPGTITLMSGHSSGSWHGSTSVLQDENGAVNQAFIEANDSQYEGRYPWPASSAREALMCHELGHALGADHTSNGTGGCMATDGNLSDTFPSDYTVETLSAHYAEPVPAPAPEHVKREKHEKKRRKHGGRH